jgi:hypothetical protein
MVSRSISSHQQAMLSPSLRGTDDDIDLQMYASLSELGESSLIDQHALKRTSSTVKHIDYNVMMSTTGVVELDL